LIEGPVTDLNVMTRRGAFVSRMERKSLTGALAFHAQSTTLALMRGAASLSGDGESLSLADGDVLIVEPNAVPRLSVAGAEVFWIEIEKIGG
jgi:hypothetical protein